MSAQDAFAHVDLQYILDYVSELVYVTEHPPQKQLRFQYVSPVRYSEAHNMT